MSPAPSNNQRDISALGRDHKELRSTMSEFATSLARLEGKIDAQTQLMERFSDRQDRAEQRIDGVEREARDEIRRIEEKFNAMSKNVWMGVGAVSLATFFIPLLIKLMTSGGM